MKSCFDCLWLKVSKSIFNFNVNNKLEARQSLSFTDWLNSWLIDSLCLNSDHVLHFFSTHLCFTHNCGRRTPSCWLLVGTYTRTLRLCIRSLPAYRPTLGTQQSEVDPICWSSRIMMQYVILTPSFTSSCSVELCNLRNIMYLNGKSNKGDKMLHS